MEHYFVGLDIGGTNTVLGIYNEKFDLLETNSFRTVKSHWPSIVRLPNDFLELLEHEIRLLVLKYTSDFHAVIAVGAGIPGTVDSKSGVVVSAVNLGWRNVPFVEEMNHRLGVPVYIDNDVRIYTLGEAFAGAGSGHSNILCLTLGTGLAAGIILEGNLIRGSTLYAGEIGHDRVEGEQRMCNCGRVGCLETVASATGIAYLAEQSLLTDSTSTLHLVAAERKLTSQDVFEACVKGDSMALGVFQKVGTILGRRLATYLFLLNTEVVIIGGGAARAGDYLLDPIRSVLREHYPPMTSGNLKVVRAQLDDRAGLYGAVYFARKCLDGIDKS